MSMISTTALSKKLEISTGDLFDLFAEAGLIEKSGDSWRLTPEGTRKGGAYQD